MRRPRAGQVLRYALSAALAAGIAIPTTGTPAVAAAPPGTPPGWRLVHTDDFSGRTLGRIWGRYGGPHGGAAASYYSADQVRVSGGLLRLRVADRPAGGRRYATGGVGSWNLVQRYGRYQFSARAPRGRGLDAYVTLWPQDQAAQQAALVEILARPGAEKAYLSNEYGTGETNRTVPGRYSDRFHTYTIEWAPRSFRVLVDGRVRLTDTRASTARRWLGFAVSSGDPLTGLPDGGTRLPAEFQVDWVRIFAYDPAAKGVAAPAPARPSTPAAIRSAVPAVSTPPATPPPTPSLASTATDPLTAATGTPAGTPAGAVTGADRGTAPLLPLAVGVLLFAGGAAVVAGRLGRRRLSRRAGRRAGSPPSAPTRTGRS